MISARPVYPFMVEGTKTISFEVTSTLGAVPDDIFCCVGGGGLLGGVHKGFDELMSLGKSQSMPRIHGGQRIDTVDQLCDWLLDVHGVAVVPGSSFGDAGCFRISFAASDEALAEGLSRMARALATHYRASRRARNVGP